jgi:hypothetical protein
MIKATPSNVAGYCVGWELPRWSYPRPSPRAQTPLHPGKLNGRAATLPPRTGRMGEMVAGISATARADTVEWSAAGNAKNNGPELMV